MKFFIASVAVICYVLACLATQSSASPAVAAAAAAAGEEESAYVDGVEALKQLEPELHGRYKRATCDLLSGMGFGHSACAAHCILRGNRGGYCNSRAVCVCRK